MNLYATIFKLHLSRLTTYRFDFLIGRLRHWIVFVLFFYVWQTVTAGNQSLAGWSGAELATYLVLINVARAVVLGGQSRQVAMDINRGRLSQYLAQPVDYFGLVYARELAERVVETASALAEGVFFVWWFGIDFVWPSTGVGALVGLVALAIGHALYVCLSFGVSLLAFWSREALGPRFLFEWILEFAAGNYFPLGILGGALGAVFMSLPFAYLLYTPAAIWLEKIPVAAWPLTLLLGLGWLTIMALGLKLLWQRGLRQFSAEGI